MEYHWKAMLILKVLVWNDSTYSENGEELWKKIFRTGELHVSFSEQASQPLHVNLAKHETKQHHPFTKKDIKALLPQKPKWLFDFYDLDPCPPSSCASIPSCTFSPLFFSSPRSFEWVSSVTQNLIIQELDPSVLLDTTRLLDWICV